MTADMRRRRVPILRRRRAAGVGIGADNITLETGDDLLLENGDVLLLAAHGDNLTLETSLDDGFLVETGEVMLLDG